MGFEERFDNWHQKVKPELEEAVESLSVRLSDAPQKLISDLTLIESKNARLQSILSEAEAFLDEGANYYMPNKEFGLTQLQMKTKMDSDLALVRGVRNRVQGLCESSKQKIMLGQSILRYQTQFIERNQSNLRYSGESPF